MRLRGFWGGRIESGRLCVVAVAVAVAAAIVGVDGAGESNRRSGHTVGVGRGGTNITTGSCGING